MAESEWGTILGKGARGDVICSKGVRGGQHGSYVTLEKKRRGRSPKGRSTKPGNSARSCQKTSTEDEVGSEVHGDLETNVVPRYVFKMGKKT